MSVLMTLELVVSTSWSWCSPVRPATDWFTGDIIHKMINKLHLSQFSALPFYFRRKILRKY